MLTADMTGTSAPDTQERSRSLFERVLRTHAGRIGAAITILLCLSALTADVLAPFAPTRMATGPRFDGPSLLHLLGTDEFGRDVFSRILLGGQLTLLVGVTAVCISLCCGTLVGLVAAFRRGWVETVLMRSCDVLFSFTETLIALACVAVLGPSLQNAVIAVGIAAIPVYARTCYAAALVETSKPYFEVSVAAGAAPFHLVWRHLLPNVLPVMCVVATLGVSNAILSVAALSFLGLGAQPPLTEWGLMLSGASDYMDVDPWLMIVPGLAIALTVLGFNLLGDGLSAALGIRGTER